MQAQLLSLNHSVQALQLDRSTAGPSLHQASEGGGGRGFALFTLPLLAPPPFDTPQGHYLARTVMSLATRGRPQTCNL